MFFWFFYYHGYCRGGCRYSFHSFSACFLSNQLRPQSGNRRPLTSRSYGFYSRYRSTGWSNRQNNSGSNAKNLSNYFSSRFGSGGSGYQFFIWLLGLPDLGGNGQRARI